LWFCTSRRPRAPAIDANEPVALELRPDADASMIMALVADATSDHVFVPEPAGPAAIAAIDLVKLAQVLPAVLVAETTATMVNAFNPSIITVEASAVALFREKATLSLAIAGEAYVPLNSGVRTRFVVFRDAFGEDPVSVIVGTPDLSRPVPARMHSACLTGDVFGSRRCDCGDQLKLALLRLQEAGGGIILYLAQEGRGVGRSHKIAAWQLRDSGLRT